MVLIVISHRVPNIKFNVAKVLQSLVPLVDQSVSTTSEKLRSLSIYVHLVPFLFFSKKFYHKLKENCHGNFAGGGEDHSPLFG